MFDLIHSYTRAQAIEDGLLVDVSAVAREAGIRFPVAITRAVWEAYVEVPEGVAAQDPDGRLWDILWMFRLAAKASTKGTSDFLFRVHVRNDNRGGIPPLVTLKAVCSPGDDGEPVITIMLPDEN